MASDSNSVVLESTSEVQDRMGDAHSKDLEHSNSTQRELSQDDYKPSSPTVLEPSTSSTTDLEISANEPANFIKSTPDDPVSTSSENNLRVAASFSKETPDEVGEIFTENRTVSSVKNVKVPPLSKKANPIQPGLSEETESTELIQSPLCEEIESSQEFQPALAEEIESTQVIQSPFSVETEEIQTPITEETTSTVVIQPVHPEKTDLTEVKQPVISEEVNLNKVIPFNSLESSCSSKALISSSDSKMAQIPSNDMINPSAVPELASKGLSENTIDLSNSKENSNSSFPPALDMESFLSMQNTEKIKNGSHFVFPGKGQVIVAPSKPCEPIFPNFEMPPLSRPTKNPSMESVEHLNSSKHATITKDVCSKKSLSTLLSMFVDWVQRGMENLFNSLEEPNIVDLMAYSRRELEYGLDLLKQMNERMYTLLRAADGLPDPTTIFPCIFESEKMSIRVSLTNAGNKVELRLKAIEAETTENYLKIVSHCRSDASFTNEFGIKQLATKTKDTLFNAFFKLSEDFETLYSDIENFRDQIRDFCLEIDRFL